MIGFASSPRFTEHNTGQYHPERADRIRAIYTALHEAGFIASDPFPYLNVNFGPLRKARQKMLELKFEPADEKWLGLVHERRHIDYVKRVCRMGGGVLDQGDTPVGPNSFSIALLAVGAVLRSCDAVMNGEVDRCFAAVRPPGHHAEPDRSLGFCLFNNIAIAARYIQKTYDVDRIAIVDFDVHHGNGTQEAFDDDRGVQFISLHQHPSTCYPGTGHDWEIGVGRARGYTLNLPFNPGAGDEEYLKVIDNIVLPELDEFRPQVMLISAGFDGHLEDPLASIELSEEGFELMTRSLVASAERYCDGRVISILEGGYNLRALGRSVVRHVIGLRGST